MSDPLMTPREVAQELRVDKRTVLRMIRTNEIDAIDIGYRTKRIRRSVLDKFLADRETGACN